MTGLIVWLFRLVCGFLLDLYIAFDPNLDSGLHIPNLVAVVGDFGSGKSFYALELGLRFANKYHKNLVANFALNPDVISDYCLLKNYNWFLKNGKIYQISIRQGSDLHHLLDQPNSVVIFDEAGVEASSYSSQSINSGSDGLEFRRKLAQIRKSSINCHLICCFQYYEQVVKQLRDLFQDVVFCSSLSQYDRRLGAPRAFYFSRVHYDRVVFEYLNSSPSENSKSVAPLLRAKYSDRLWVPINLISHELYKLLLLPFFPLLSSRRRRIFSLPSSLDLLFASYNSLGFVGSLPDSGRPILVWSARAGERSSRKNRVVYVTNADSSSGSKVLAFRRRA